MREPNERDLELFKLELAANMPASGESFSDWARNNPDAEYGLWMTIAHPEDKVEKAILRRVRSAERGPKWVMARAVGSGALALGLDGAAIEHVVHNPSDFGKSLALGAISLFPWGLVKAHLGDLPKARATARKERELYERGMQARAEARLILRAEEN